VKAGDLLVLLRAIYQDKAALWRRHEAGARRVGRYVFNNTYQYVIAREDTHLAWLRDAIVGMGGTLSDLPLTSAVDPTGSGRDHQRGSDALRGFIERWRTKIDAVSNARHRLMLTLLMGETPRSRFLEQALAGRPAGRTPARRPPVQSWHALDGIGASHGPSATPGGHRARQQLGDQRASRARRRSPPATLGEPGRIALQRDRACRSSPRKVVFNGASRVSGGERRGTARLPAGGRGERGWSACTGALRTLDLDSSSSAGAVIDEPGSSFPSALRAPLRAPAARRSPGHARSGDRPTIRQLLRASQVPGSVPGPTPRRPQPAGLSLKPSPRCRMSSTGGAT
jgi:hypothetical protein